MGGMTCIAIQHKGGEEMNVTKLKVGVFLSIMVLLALAACGGGGGDSDEPTSEPAPPSSDEAPVQATEAVVAPTEPPASGGEEDPAPAPTEAPVVEPTAEPEPESEIPYDIAIMEGATNLDIQETSVSYRMEQAEIETVVEFYHAHMTEQGWESLTDSTIGLMATLVYESDEARVSVKLQANNFAETVDVTILVFTK
jgi:hypothetical protein